MLNSGDSLDDVPNNPATEWRLIGTSALAAPPIRRLGIRTLALVGSIEVLLALGAAYGYHIHTHHHHHHHDLTAVAAQVPVRVR